MKSSFFEPLHNFLIAPLVVKLRKETESLRIFNQQDLIANAYLLINKFIGNMPDWHIRCSPRFGIRNPDLVIFQNYNIRAVCQFVFGLTTERESFLPTDEIEENVTWLKELLSQRAPEGQAYVVILYDYEQRWFVPEVQEKQTIFIVPANCQDIPLHHIWRPKWDELKKHLF